MGYRLAVSLFAVTCLKKACQNMIPMNGITKQYQNML